MEKSEILKYSFFGILIALLFSPVGSGLQIDLVILLIIVAAAWLYFRKD